jgi:hypothetical protein
MTARRLILGATAASFLLAADAPGGQPPARPAPATVRWSTGGGDSPARVEVLGLSRANLEALAGPGWDVSRWPAVFAVSVAPAGPKTPAIAGRYAVDGRVVRFEPRFPFEPGVRYVARVRTVGLPEPGEREVTSEFTPPAAERGEPAAVVRVDPEGDRLPENLLKFYLHFSKPMGRGKAYQHVRLLDDGGRPLRRPFLEIGEELWDPSGTRLTLLLDPGRIKRGLRPREEEGPVLEPGKTYTLVVDARWPDASGYPLRETFRKVFRAGPADETQPDPKTWKINAPAAGSTDRLALDFPEPLDRALLDRCIGVHGPDGRAVAGDAAVSAEGSRWEFEPARAWPAGTFQLVIDTELEDLAGNSIARPFEVDVLGPVTRRTESKTVAVPFVVRPRP